MKDDNQDPAAVQALGEAEPLLDGELSKKYLLYVRCRTDAAALQAHDAVFSQLDLMNGMSYLGITGNKLRR